MSGAGRASSSGLRSCLSRRKLLLIVGIAGGVAALTTFWLERTWGYRLVESIWVDTVSALFPGRPHPDVTVVAIGAPEFRDPTLFSSMAPLHPAPIEQLVRRVSAMRPGVIVLDLLIEPVAYESDNRADARRRLYGLIDSLAQGAIPLVCVQGTAALDTSGIRPDVLRSWRELASEHRGQRPSLHWSHPTLPLDPIRGIVRSLELGVPGDQPGTSNVLDVVARIATRHSAERAEPTKHHVQPHPMLIRFSGAYQNRARTGLPSPEYVPAAMILHGARTREGRDPVSAGKIVLIGGVYPEARDEQWTPLGPMPGVLIWAEAIGTWRWGSWPRHPHTGALFLVSWSIGILTGIALCWRLNIGSVAALIGVVILVAAATYSMFNGALRYFVTFLPEIGALFLHHYAEVRLELAKHSRELVGVTRDLDVVTAERDAAVKRLEVATRMIPATPISDDLAGGSTSGRPEPESGS